MKRYIRCKDDTKKKGKYVKSSITSNKSKALQYYNIFDNESDFKRETGLTDEDIFFHVGESPEDYDDYKVVGYAVAKDEYADLENIGYDVVEIYQDSTGYAFPGYIVGGRLYDITEEVIDALEGNN